MTTFAVARRLFSASTLVKQTAAAASESISSGGATGAPAAGGAYISYDTRSQQPAFLSLSLAGSNVRFKLRPDRPIHALLQQIQEESGAKNVNVLTEEEDGGSVIRWCRSTVTEDVLREGLRNNMRVIIGIDDVPIRVELPSLTERIKPLQEQQASLAARLRDLESIKLKCDKMSAKSANRLVWAGLAGLCAQWGLMARLTWWEYSWDVMEPISYFISFGTGIVGYMFFTVTRREYTYETMTDMHMTSKQSKLYREMGLDILEYLAVRGQLQSLNRQIEQARSEYRLPPPPSPAPSIVPPSAEPLP
ncbi:hypothetical protein RI367_002188 [Sorochytrium milnesiophthora]